MANVVIANDAFELWLDNRLLEHTRGDTTDVERAHRQLRARLADGLRGNDADRFAELHARAGGEVAPVTGHADAMLAFASEHRTNLDLLCAAGLDGLGGVFVDFAAGLYQQLLGIAWVANVFAREASNDAFGQFHHFIFAFIDRLHPNAVGCAAIVNLHDHVLRDIDKLAGEVTRVGSLKGRVGQTFARTVGRNEVFQDSQAFAEVRENRFLDDVTGRLGHQPADTGQLANLLAIAARAGVHHQRDRIELLLALVAVQCLQHHVRDLVSAMRPDIDDLVVAFAGRDHAFAILLLDFGNLLLRVLNFLALLLRDDHIIDPDGATGFGRLAEAQFLQTIEHNDSAFLPAVFVAIPNQITQRALADDLIGKAEVLRPNLAE